MGKHLAILAVILSLSVPLHAAVTVSCARVGTTKTFTVSYAFDGVGAAPRAFALDITTNRGTIAGVTATKTGESTSGSKGFGIFPGTIVIDSAAGTISTIGSPIAPQTDLPSGTLAGIGSSGVTVELGSLYGDSSSKPATSGVLVTVGLNGYTSGTATITVSSNMARNGVVLEDGTSIVAFGASCVLAPPPCDCFCSLLSTYARWVSLGKPACWCPPASVTGCPVGGTGYQCVGDVAQDKAPITNYRVYTSDLSLISSCWKRVNCAGCECADIDHAVTPITNYCVYSGDLNRISAFWKRIDAQLNTILGVGTTGGYCGSCTMNPAYK